MSRYKQAMPRVEAKPDAKPTRPVELTETNSTADPFYPDIRYLNEDQRPRRRFAVATSLEEAARDRKKSTVKASAAAGDGTA